MPSVSHSTMMSTRQNSASILYSRRMNTMAPRWIVFGDFRDLGLPGGELLDLVVDVPGGGKTDDAEHGWYESVTAHGSLPENRAREWRDGDKVVVHAGRRSVHELFIKGAEV